MALPRLSRKGTADQNCATFKPESKKVFVAFVLRKTDFLLSITLIFFSQDPQKKFVINSLVLNDHKYLTDSENQLQRRWSGKLFHIFILLTKNVFN